MGCVAAWGRWPRRSPRKRWESVCALTRLRVPRPCTRTAAGAVRACGGGRGQGPVGHIRVARQRCGRNGGGAGGRVAACCRPAVRAPARTSRLGCAAAQHPQPATLSDSSLACSAGTAAAAGRLLRRCPGVVAAGGTAVSLLFGPLPAPAAPAAPAVVSV